MKKVRIILVVATLFFGAMAYYFMTQADGGADGLSSFMPMVLFGVLFLCSVIGFLVTLILRKKHSVRTRNWIIGAAITLPIMGLILVIGVFGYFSFQYQSDWENKVANEKSVLETQQFTDEDFGVSFQHISGRVTMYEGGKPIPTPLTPRIENNMLLVPFDDDSYLDPDVLIKVENEKAITVQNYFSGLKTKLDLKDVVLKEQDLGYFKNLGNGTKLWKAEANVKERKKLADYFLPVKKGRA